ncbi:cysteine desulfurase family protein [Kyrpidia spormannii]|uniref:cysteine desulfurase n=2 Tax=Kyrpidia spormannii TaxID=2055160 RepID=A0A6F9E7A5_9BACL|nr:cysteine desulfurase family protein [Kyrpidia spormannii]CAB3392182.1 Cysteine desulfurase NifS [Kyrpidia spormannii]CAB3393104.1 Cysteine desulfurase NifS [Kyrpidia spormannii]
MSEKSVFYYLDYAATTPPSDSAIQRMTQVMESYWGNPSSQHGRGALARKIVEEAREEVAGWLSCRPSEVIFTSGGTESNQLALWGTVSGMRAREAYPRRRQILLSAVEHHSVIACAAALRQQGYEVQFLAVDRQGRVSPDGLAQALSEYTFLVSVQWVNSEVGTVQPIKELARISREAGALFHTDAVAAASVFDVAAACSEVDLLSISGHKVYGPQGTGILFLRRGTPFRFPFGPGRQERGRRPGTENVPGIAGLAEAVRGLRKEYQLRGVHLEQTRRRLWSALEIRKLGLVRFTPQQESHPGILTVGVPGENGDGLVVALSQRGLQVSSGSACRSGEGQPSPVLLAMGFPEDAAMGMIRFSFGQELSSHAVEDIAERFAATLHAVRV